MERDVPVLQAHGQIIAATPSHAVPARATEKTKKNNNCKTQANKAKTQSKQGKKKNKK